MLIGITYAGRYAGLLDFAAAAEGRTDELAVMIDTHRPLMLTPAALAIDDPSYPYSWLE